MYLKERAAGDIGELQRRAGRERDALRRDRYRAVLLALVAGVYFKLLRK